MDTKNELEINSIKNSFKAQFDNNNIIKKDILPILQGKPLYGEYQEGDKLLYFVETQKDDDDNIHATLQVITERTLNNLEEDFNCVESFEGYLPVFKRKITNIANNKV